MGDVERHPHRQDQVLIAPVIPENLAESFQPVIGQAVTIRPLRPDDLPIEAEFLQGLSLETRSSRLLGGAIKISHAYLERLTNVDYPREMAFAASLMLENSERMIGVARYVTAEDGRSCEFAIVIADDWQGKGIGSRMIEKLVVVARAAGLAEMHGDVLAQNRPMLELMKKLGFRLSRHPEDGTLLRVTYALAGSPPARG